MNTDGALPVLTYHAIDLAGHFDPSPEVQGRSDWDQWLRLSWHCDFAMVEEVPWVLPPKSYARIWRSVARRMFGITPGVAFMPGYDAVRS